MARLANVKLRARVQALIHYTDDEIYRNARPERMTAEDDKFKAHRDEFEAIRTALGRYYH